MVRATWQLFCEVRWLSAVREYTHLGLYICTYRPLLHSALFVFTAPTAGRVRKFKGCLAQTDRVFSGAVKVVEEEEEEEARDKGAIWPQQRDSQTNINCTRSWGSEYLLGLLLSIARCVYCKDVTHTEQWEHWILGSVEPNERLCRPAPTFVRLCVCMSVVLACVCVCARTFFRDGSSRNTFLSQTVVCSSQDIFFAMHDSHYLQKWIHAHFKLQIRGVRGVCAVQPSEPQTKRREQRFIKSTLSLQSVPFIGCEDSSRLRCGSCSEMTWLWAIFPFWRNNSHTSKSRTKLWAEIILKKCYIHIL